MHTEHFKMEGIHLLKDLLRKGDWMIKVDLKDAYFMIPIHEQDRDFLKFTFRDKCYGVQLPAVRSSMCTLGFHQGCEATSS